MSVGRINIWLKNKYTHAFDVSMNNRAFFIRVEVMESICNSQDLNDTVRWATNTRHTCNILMDEDRRLGFAHNHTHSPWA